MMYLTLVLLAAASFFSHSAIAQMGCSTRSDNNSFYCYDSAHGGNLRFEYSIYQPYRWSKSGAIGYFQTARPHSSLNAPAVILICRPENARLTQEYDVSTGQYRQVRKQSSTVIVDHSAGSTVFGEIDPTNNVRHTDGVACYVSDSQRTASTGGQQRFTMSATIRNLCEIFRRTRSPAFTDWLRRYCTPYGI